MKTWTNGFNIYHWKSDSGANTSRIEQRWPAKRGAKGTRAKIDVGEKKFVYAHKDRGEWIIQFAHVEKGSIEWFHMTPSDKFLSLKQALAVLAYVKEKGACHFVEAGSSVTVGIVGKDEGDRLYRAYNVQTKEYVLSTILSTESKP